MRQVFVIRNQDGLYLTKQHEWHTGDEANLLFKSDHHDVALNTLIEINAKDFTLRLEIIAVETNEKGIPLVDVQADKGAEISNASVDDDTASGGMANEAAAEV